MDNELGVGPQVESLEALNTQLFRFVAKCVSTWLQSIVITSSWRAGTHVRNAF